MKIFKKDNAKQFPKIYYAKHITPGVAQYFESGKSEMILVQLDVLKNMNPTFKGKPIYVKHVDDVDLSKMQEEAAGYVVESIYNPLDGAMWAKMVIVSDAGHQAISQGWKVSNSYSYNMNNTKGTWHNVDYDAEVVGGEYNHLALVPNPRYEEAVILSEEEYKRYNQKKEEELKQLQNSKGEKPMSIYSKIIALIKNVEEEEKKAPKQEDELDKKINIGDYEVTLRDLVNCYIETSKKNAEDKAKNEEEEKKNAEEAAKKKEDEDKKNAEEAKAKEEAEKKANEDKEKVETEKKNALEDEQKAKEEEAKKIADENFKKLQNAHLDAPVVTHETSMEKVERGQVRYGSKK